MSNKFINKNVNITNINKYGYSFRFASIKSKYVSLVSVKNN